MLAVWRTTGNQATPFTTKKITLFGLRNTASKFFVASSGNVTDEVIIKYIEQQNIESPDGDLSVIMWHGGET